MIENYGLSLADHIGQAAPGQQELFDGGPSGRDGSLRSGIPFEPLVNSPNDFVVSADSDGLLYSSAWLSVVTAGAADQLVFNTGPQCQLARYHDEVARFASHSHELALSLRAPFGMAQPRATIVSLDPALDAVDGNTAVQVRAWRESPAGAAGDCVHLVLVNSADIAVRFVAHVAGLIPPWEGFRWPCDCPGAGNVCDICFARRLFVPGPQLNVSANGTLGEGSLGPGDTAIFRIGCAAPGTHPWASPAANLANNPSFEENGGDPNFAHGDFPPSRVSAGDIFVGTSKWEVPRQLDGHDPRASLVADTIVAYAGRHSLKVHCPTDRPLVFGVAGTQQSKGGGADACYEDGKSTEISIRLQPGRRYSVMLQAQASPAGTRLALVQGFWTTACSYPTVMPPPAEGCPFTQVALHHEQTLGTHWGNVSSTFTVQRNCSGLQLLVTPANRYGATVWIDAVQVLME